MSIFTLSREYGAGGRELATAISEKLGYACLDKQSMLKILKDSGSDWEEWAKGLDEHSPTVWEKFDWSFRGFAALVKRIILEESDNDNVIIVERGGNFLLENVPHAYRIRLIADKESKLDRIMMRESVDYDTAEWLSERTDEERARFILSMYSKDWADEANYDAVYNSSKTNVQEITNIVCNELERKASLKTVESAYDLHFRAIAAKIEAGLLTAPNLFITVLDVIVEENSLILRGIVRDPKHKKRVEEAAKKIAGDIPLKMHLHYRA